MTDTSNALVLALLATLEAKAKKKGRKSLVKQVIQQLRVSGADHALIDQVAALSPSKPSETAPPKVAAKPKPEAKPKSPRAVSTPA
jgi:hypothetical protein